MITCISVYFLWSMKLLFNTINVLLCFIVVRYWSFFQNVRIYPLVRWQSNGSRTMIEEIIENTGQLVTLMYWNMRSPQNKSKTHVSLHVDIINMFITGTQCLSKLGICFAYYYFMLYPSQSDPLFPGNVILSYCVLRFVQPTAITF